MKKSLFLVFLVLAIVSCRGKISHIYETPFPLDEMNAYFDIPFDTVCFVSNNGDTLVFEYEAYAREYVYTPYKYHGEGGEQSEKNDNDEEDAEDEEYESDFYDMQEFYVRRGYYLVPGTSIWEGEGLVSPYISSHIYIASRSSSMIEIGVNPAPGVGTSYSEKFRTSKPSNDIFKFFKDTMIINSVHVTDKPNGIVVVPNDKNHVVFVRGKGVVEFSLKDNTEVWHLVE